MTVTVESLLALPSFRGAKVVAGKSSLKNIVTAVSVLEAVETYELESMARDETPYRGSELILTGFTNAKDDIELQCNSIMHLSKIGAAAVVLYYVGIDIKCVHEKLINISNELGFPLIVMPENRPDLRYSDVISEVMEAIIENRMESSSFINDIFYQFFRLPEERHSIDTLLKIIRDRLHLTVGIEDEEGKLINLATWPAMDSGENVFPEEDVFISKKTINIKEGGMLHVVVGSHTKQLDDKLLLQIAELIRYFIELHSDHHGQMISSELIRAILQDEVLNMHRLSQYFNVDINKLNTLWVFSFEGQEQKLEELWPAETIKEIMGEYSSLYIAGRFENNYIVMLERSSRYGDYRDLAERIFSSVKNQAGEKGNLIYLSQKTNCKDLTAARECYLTHKELFQEARKIFPLKRILNDSDYIIVAQCRNFIEGGAKEIDKQLQLLEPIFACPKNEGLIDTLTTYLLDAGASIQETSEYMFLHRSTVKYRLNNIANILGYKVDELSGIVSLSYAVAINRLLNQEI